MCERSSHFSGDSSQVCKADFPTVQDTSSPDLHPFYGSPEGTQVQFPSPTQQLPAFCNSSARGPDSLLASTGTAGTQCTCRQNTHIYFLKSRTLDTNPLEAEKQPFLELSD